MWTYALLRLLTGEGKDPIVRVMRARILPLTLSIQTNRADIGRDFLLKLHAWSPSWAKSFHLVRFETHRLPRTVCRRTYRLCQIRS